MMSGYTYLLIVVLFSFSAGMNNGEDDPSFNLKYPQEKDRCGWYMNDLERFLPCRNNQFDYVNYATSYCRKYDEIYDEASTQQKDFIDTGRLCLQRKIYFYLEKNPDASCQDIEKFSFASHDDCYSKAGFCNLPFSDKMQVINLVKGSAFNPKNGRGKETIKSALEVLTSCINNPRQLKRSVISKREQTE